MINQTKDNITLDDVKKLREKTGCHMYYCLQALRRFGKLCDDNKKDIMEFLKEKQMHHGCLIDYRIIER